MSHYVRISNPEELNREYRVSDRDQTWLMNAPLFTIRKVYGLENPAINRVIANKVIELFLSRTGTSIIVERVS